MKILYVGPILDSSGYSRAGLDYIAALHNIGFDVVPRALKLNHLPPNIPQDYKGLLRKDHNGCDICIQHSLPVHFSRGDFKLNIGLFASETDTLPARWVDHLNLLDHVFVINRQMKKACEKSGVELPISVIPHCFNMHMIGRSFEPIPELAQRKKEGRFLFYFVGEMVRRKNLIGLLRAFHAEFWNDPVDLVLKVNVPGQSHEESAKTVREFCEGVRQTLKFKSGPEILIGGRLSEHDMLRLHSSCDCYVSASYGEAWGQADFTAMALGKTPITSASTGYLDWNSAETGWLVPTRLEPCFCLEGPEDYYEGRQNWWGPDLMALRRAMREAYESPPERECRGIQGMKRAYDFSYEAVGALLKTTLDSLWTGKNCGKSP